MNAFIAKADFYQTKPKLFIKANSESISSKLGVILSIITILSIIPIIIYSLLGFLQRVNYVNTFNQESKKVYSLDLSQQPIFFTIWNHQEINFAREYDKIFSFSAIHYSFDPTDSNRTVNTALKFENCTENKIARKNSDYFPEKIRLEKFECLAFPNGTNVNTTKIMGEYGSFDGDSGIVIWLKRCVNTTKNKNKCLDNDKITEKIKNLSVVWGSLDYDINHDSFWNPFQPKIFTQSLILMENLITMVNIKNKLVEYFSENGFFFKGYKKDFRSVHHTTDYYTINKSNENSMIMYIHLTTSGIKEIHFRKYQKVQEALTIVSTMINIVKLICGMIMNFFSDKIFFEHLINFILLQSYKDVERKKDGDKRKLPKFNIIKEIMLPSFIEMQGNMDNELKRDFNIKRNSYGNDIKFDDSNIHKSPTIDLKIDPKIKDKIMNENDININLVTLKDLKRKQTDFKSKEMKEAAAIYNNNKENELSETMKIDSNLSCNRLKLSNLKCLDSNKIEKENIFINNIGKESKRTSFSLDLKDYFLSVFSNKENQNVRKYRYFVCVIKKLLSVEGLLQNANEMFDLNKI